MSDTGTQTKNAEQVQDTPLTIREHLDPDKHWIGETLAPPTQGEIEATIGTTSGPGESPFVARADHKHKIDPTLLPAVIPWTVAWSGLNRGTGYTEVAFAWQQSIIGTTRKIVYIEYFLSFGTGTVGPTGDCTITLPVTCSTRMGIIGVAQAGVRFSVLMHTITNNASSALVRPLFNRPTSTNATMPVENGIALNAFLGLTWATGDWISFNGMYFTSG